MALGGFLGGLANLGTVNAGINQGAESGSDALLRMLALRQAQQQMQAQELMPRYLEAIAAQQQQQAPPAPPPDASFGPAPMMMPPAVPDYAGAFPGPQAAPLDGRPVSAPQGFGTGMRVPFSAVAPIIEQAESGGRNIPSAIPGSTAGGVEQINDPTWQDYAPKVGAGAYPNALSAPIPVQRQVGEALYNARGTQPWVAPGIPKLGPGGARPPLGGGGARMIPGLPPETGQQITSLAHGAAMSFPPQEWGRTQLPALVKALHDAAPDAPEGVKFAALAMAANLLAPDQRMAWEMFKMQNQDQFRMMLAEMQGQIRAGMPITPYQQGELDIRKGELGERQRHDAEMEAGAGKQGTIVKTDAGDVYRIGPQGTQPEKIEFPEGTGGVEKLGGGYNPRSAVGIYMKSWLKEHPKAGSEETLNAENNFAYSQSINRSLGGGMTGRNLQSLNTVADHIMRVKEYADALRNGQIPRANQLANRIAKEAGKPAVTTFEAGRDIMADEIVRLLTSTGGTEADRQGMQTRLSAMMSPPQFAGVFQTFVDFTGARFKAIEQSYARNDPAKMKEFEETFLTPEARQIWQTFRPVGGAAPAAAPSAPGVVPGAEGDMPGAPAPSFGGGQGMVPIPQNRHPEMGPAGDVPLPDALKNAPRDKVMYNPTTGKYWYNGKIY